MYIPSVPSERSIVCILIAVSQTPSSKSAILVPFLIILDDIVLFQKDQHKLEYGNGRVAHQTIYEPVPDGERHSLSCRPHPPRPAESRPRFPETGTLPTAHPDDQPGDAAIAI